MAKRRARWTLTLILGGLFIIVAITAAIVAFNLVSNIVKNLEHALHSGRPDLPSQRSSTPKAHLLRPDVPLQTGSGPAAQPWDGASRVTILIMGLDYSDWRKQTEGFTEASRTDSMILLTVDPLSKTAGMLSIPAICG